MVNLTINSRSLVMSSNKLKEEDNSYLKEIKKSHNMKTKLPYSPNSYKDSMESLKRKTTKSEPLEVRLLKCKKI